MYAQTHNRHIHKIKNKKKKKEMESGKLITALIPLLERRKQEKLFEVEFKASLVCLTRHCIGAWGTKLSYL